MMRKPVEMLKLFILYHKSIDLDLITYLHEIGSVEITKLPESEHLSPASKGNYEQITMYYLVLQDLLRNLDINIAYPNNPIVRSDKEVIEVARSLSSLESEVKALKSKLSSAVSEKEVLSQRLSELEFLASLGIDPKYLSLKSVNLLLLLGPAEGLNDVADRNEMFKVGMVAGKALYLAINQERIPTGFTKVDFKGIASLEELRAAIDDCKKQLSVIELFESRAHSRLNELRESNRELLSGIMYELEVWKQRYEVLFDSGRTFSLAVLSCWVEASRFGLFESSLHDRFGTDVSVFVAGSSSTLEDAPTLLSNKEAYVKPFEFVVKMLSIPKASEIDPSIIFALVIPVMYGMIVGDVGYALVSVVLSNFFKSKFKNSEMLQNVANIWIFSSVFAVLFGLVFDEWFGLSFKNFVKIIGINADKNPLQMLGINISLHRLAVLPLLIFYCLLLGSGLMVLGFLLGAVSEFSHNKKHAIGKICWMFFVISLLLVIPNAFFGTSIFKLGSWELNVGLILFGLSVLGIVITEGAAGLFELAGVGGNIMSFIRIAAVGVAGVIIAEIINMNFTPVLANPIMFVIITLLFFLLHTINAVIAMAEGLIQGGRLGIVEFSTKFFHGGGREFKPFKLPFKD